MNVKYPKIYKSWTTPCLSYPRWLEANSFDASFLEELPNRIPPAQTVGIINNYTLNSVNTTYQLVEPTSILDTSSIRSITEAITSGYDLLSTQAEETFTKNFSSVDQSYCPIVWVTKLNTDLPVANLTLKLSLGTVTLPKIDTLDELFQTPRWAYFQQDDFVVVYGLEISEYTTVKDTNNWHYLPHSNTWDFISNYWLLNPDTNQWVYYSAKSILEDYHLPLNTNSNSKVRLRITSRVALLNEVYCTIDGTDYTLNKKVLWNDIDDKLVFHSTSRRFNEDNTKLATQYYVLNNFSGISKKRFKNLLSGYLRTGENIFISNDQSSATLPLTTDVTINHTDMVNYIRVPFIKSTEYYVSPLNISSNFDVFYAGNHKQPQIINNNKINFLSDINSDQIIPFARSKVTNFTQTGNTLNFGFKYKTEIISVYQPNKVDIVETSSKPLPVMAAWQINTKSGQSTFI